MEDKLELIKVFWSQRNKLFTKTNAVRGLAEYRTFQSRLNTELTAVESFEVSKMCLGKDFEPVRLAQQPLPETISRNVELDDIIEHNGKEAKQTIAENGLGMQYDSLLSRHGE
jgi:hypothetical protein